MTNMLHLNTARTWKTRHLRDALLETLALGSSRCKKTVNYSQSFQNDQSQPRGMKNFLKVEWLKKVIKVKCSTGDTTVQRQHVYLNHNRFISSQTKDTTHDEFTVAELQQWWGVIETAVAGEAVLHSLPSFLRYLPVTFAGWPLQHSVHSTSSLLGSACQCQSPWQPIHAR